MFFRRLFLILCLFLTDRLTVLAQKPSAGFTVSINLAASINDLHPFLASGTNSSYIQANVFGGLLERDPKTGALRPLYAVNRPTVETVSTGKYAGKWKINYEIRPQAVWDDGTPITGEDFIFSLKIIRHPLIPLNSAQRGVSFIDSVEIDVNNPKKFSIYCNENVFLAESASGLVTLVPPYLYDPNNALRSVPFHYFSDENLRYALSKDSLQKAFAEQFVSAKYRNNPKYINSGLSYRVREMVGEKRIVLERKSNWWGDTVKEDAPALRTYPAEIIYRRAETDIEALQELKDGKLDVMRFSRPAIFVDLLNNPAFNERFTVVAAKQYYYYYIGHNFRKPQLADGRVRWALAHLFDRDQFIDEFLKGMGTPISNPISPYKDFYNKKLKPVDFNPSKAKKLLAEAGWKDTDGNGILDKVVDGKKEEMRLEFTYNKENYIRRHIGLLLQDEARKVGIDITVRPYLWDTLMNKLNTGDFDMYCLAMVQEPGWDDLIRYWHSQSVYPNGTNRSYLLNEQLDRILDSIKTTLDEKALKKLYGQAQEILYEEQPQTFLFTSKQMLVISKRFNNADPTAISPNFAERFFQLK